MGRRCVHLGCSTDAPPELHRRVCACACVLQDAVVVAVATMEEVGAAQGASASPCTGSQGGRAVPPGTSLRSVCLCCLPAGRGGGGGGRGGGRGQMSEQSAIMEIRATFQGTQIAVKPDQQVTTTLPRLSSHTLLHSPLSPHCIPNLPGLNPTALPQNPASVVTHLFLALCVVYAVHRWTVSRLDPTSATRVSL